MKPKDTLLVRGGTCALGYAAIQIARALGCHVTATTHRESKLHLLEEAGADECILDDGNLSEKCGTVCNTGVLGGVFALNGFDPIKDIPNGVYLTGFFSNYPTQQIMDAIFSFLKEKKLVPISGRVYTFDRIREAVTAQDEGRVNGKIIVRI